MAKQSIERSALIWHPAERMFHLVNDIDAYPRFLPWCSNAEVHSGAGGDVLASIEISKGGVRQRFTTRNRLEVPRRIEMELVEGPFTSLQGNWTFLELDKAASKVMLSLEFELTGRWTGMAFGNVFAQVANTLVDAFCARANVLYGEKHG